MGKMIQFFSIIATVSGFGQLFMFSIHYFPISSFLNFSLSIYINFYYKKH